MAVCVAYRIPHSEFASWSAPDRDKALWWQAREAERCDSCGTRPSEWAADRHAYSAKKTRCLGCEAKERAEASIRKDEGKGVRVEMHRNRSGGGGGG